MNSAQPRVMCARCQAIFPEPDNSKSDNHKGDNHGVVTCPKCGYEGAPRGVMHAATFPSLDAFRHNWQASRHASEQDANNNASDT